MLVCVLDIVGHVERASCFSLPIAGRYLVWDIRRVSIIGGHALIGCSMILSEIDIAVHAHCWSGIVFHVGGF